MVLWGCPPPRGYLSVSSVPPEEHGIKEPVSHPPGGPLVGPAQPPVHLPNQGEGLLFQRVVGPCPSPGPRAGPPLPPALASPAAPVPAAPMPRPAPTPPRPSAPAQLSARGGLAGAGVVGVWGGRACRRQGRCCRGGGGSGGGGRCGAPASVGCRGGCTSPAARPAAGGPALRPPLFNPASPPGSHAPSRLSLGARGALALALGPLSGPLPVPRVPTPVPHALARPLAHHPSPRSLHLGALPTPLRALSVPWSLPGPLP